MQQSGNIRTVLMVKYSNRAVTYSVWIIEGLDNRGPTVMNILFECRPLHTYLCMYTVHNDVSPAGISNVKKKAATRDRRINGS